jgi:hypothetical protein
MGLCEDIERLQRMAERKARAKQLAARRSARADYAPLLFEALEDMTLVRNLTGERKTEIRALLDEARETCA